VFCDAGALPRLVAAIVVLGGMAFVVSRLGLSMLATQTSIRTPQFWWMLAAFAGPLGLANLVLFCDGLFVQFAVIMLVAGGGIWLGDRVIERRRR
jgi:hypothetical protein